MARPSVKTERRAQILDGLYEAMALQGTKGTSITEIAKAAGIARGALHYYFDSKEEIRVRLMERLGARYLENLGTFLASREDRLDALARYHLGGDETESERLLTVWIDYWGQAPSDPEVNAVVFEVQTGARKLCAESLAHDAARQGRILDDSACRARAPAMLALIEGALLQWRVASQTDSPLPRNTLRVEVTIGLRALAAAPSMQTAGIQATASDEAEPKIEAKAAPASVSDAA